MKYRLSIGSGAPATPWTTRCCSLHSCGASGPSWGRAGGVAVDEHRVVGRLRGRCGALPGGDRAVGVAADGLGSAGAASFRGARREAEVGAVIGALHEIDLGRSALDEAAVAEMERTAPDLIPSFVQTLKPRSAWRSGAAPTPQAPPRAAARSFPSAAEPAARMCPERAARRGVIRPGAPGLRGSCGARAHARGA